MRDDGQLRSLYFTEAELQRCTNLHKDDADYSLWVERLLSSFSGNAVEVPTLKKRNCIVLASRSAVLSSRRINLKQSLAAMSREASLQLKSGYPRITWCMKELTNSG